MSFKYLKDIIKEFNLINLSEDDFGNVKITTTNVNRPGLHLLGFFETFDTNRIQVLGEGEMTFLSTLSTEHRKEILNKFFSYKIPCVIIARDLPVFPEMLEYSKKYKVPVLKTLQDTPTFIAELISYLTYELAQKTSVHGVLVEVYGEGILILGESGIGKSETALELIKRGHSFIADDIVEIKKISYNTLEGQAPPLLKYFIEIRGLGLIDIERIFGMGAIKDSYLIDMVINLENWNENKEYDRLGLDQAYMEILGIKLPYVTIPVKPGRNLAVIIESAAMNLRQKNLGYNAAKVLNKRVTEEIKKKTKNKNSDLHILETEA